ncbi:hypothetical protein [Roseicella aerolata]|uniref:Uncharacterized protein n=1 Tax=Roseicella aerolata TaxID=2883479 RepID=A0A9X1LDJ7_9PROT|nr:hypothetical protein [Roseicella aerolata]MCB4825370.1 hypothetical protein [Roseicella aerolata]
MLKARETIALGSRRQPASFTVKDNVPAPVATPVADDRAEGFESAARTAAEIEDAVRSSLRSAQIELPEEAFTRITSVVRDVSRHFGNMRDEAVKVGRRLLRLREEHSAVYAALFRIVDGRCAMPFSPATASRMCAVARFVDEGKVPQDRLPLAYSAAYEIVRLDDEGLLLEAEKDGLVSPRTSRSAVLTWKRGRRPVLDDPRRVLLEEKTRLLERLARIDDELRELGAEA